MIRWHKHISLSALAVVLIAAFCFLRVANNHRYTDPERVIAWDVVSYYAYLPATFVEHDLTLSFTDHEHSGIYWPAEVEGGGKVIKTSMGLSFMYLPFFLVAHISAPLLGYPPNGFSPPYAFALMMAGLVYMILGLLILRRILLPHFSEAIVAATLIIISLCTNLYWYSVYEAPMSHAFSFCLFALFAWLTERWHADPSLLRSVGIGLTIGLISLVRPSNIIVVVYFLFYGISGKAFLRQQMGRLLHAWPQLLLVVACAVCVWVPQMAYWYANTGHLLFYSYGTTERFFFAHPKVLQGLFSFRKGWLVYTPAMFFALVGLLPLYAKYRERFWATVLFVVVNLYVVFSWWCWWYGGGLGLRALIESYALLAFPLATWIQWVLQRRVFQRALLLLAMLLVCGLSAFHNVQYVHGAIHWDSMTPAAYADSFLRLYPSPRFEALLSPPDYEAARQGVR